MSKVKEYVTISDTDLYALDRSVNSKLAKGWEPLGGVAAVAIVHSYHSRYIQAMVRHSATNQAEVSAAQMTKSAKENKRHSGIIGFYVNALIRAGNEKIANSANRGEQEVILRLEEYSLHFFDRIIDGFLPILGQAEISDIEKGLTEHFKRQGFLVYPMTWYSRRAINIVWGKEDMAQLLESI